MFRFNDSRVYADYADGQYIVLNHVNGEYYSFDKASSAVLRALVSGCSAESVTDALESLYGKECGVSAKIGDFVEKLRASEIVIQDEAESGNAEEYLRDITEQSMPDIDFDVFTDVADLLMMDPIHEVDEEAGWPVQKQ